MLVDTLLICGPVAQVLGWQAHDHHMSVIVGTTIVVVKMWCGCFTLCLKGLV